MSGGIAYVLDEDNHLYRNLNKEMVLMETPTAKSDKESLRTMLENHVKYTNSAKAKAILADFENYLPKFKKIIPADYKKMIQLTADYMEQGMSEEKAQIEAFYTSLEKRA
jgi:glutamate synthase (ferredoxin)